MKCKCIAITGASGFVGSRLVQSLMQRPEIEVRALVRHGLPPQVAGDRQPTIVRGNVTDPSVLAQLLRPDCMVANFAYDAAASAGANLAAASALADACASCGVARFVHCSTAVVVGRTKVERIDETTACQPMTNYEKSKFAIENLLQDKSRGKFELLILRPTAVFGPGGRNLLKMTQDLINGRRMTNYLRSCLNDGRRLHLVDIDNVVAAMVFLITAQNAFDGETFIIADDEAPDNNFPAVERHLMRAFAIPDYGVPRIPIPASLLSLILRLRRRSLHIPNAVFVSDKLKALGFVKPVAFEEGLANFADWYRNTHMINVTMA